MSPDGRYLASGSRDGHIRIWDLASGVIVHQRQLNGHHLGVDSQTPSPIDALGYFPDSSSILFATERFIVKLIPDTLLPEARPISTSYRGVQCITVSKELEVVAVGLEDGTIAILNAGTLSKIQQCQTDTSRINAIAFDTSGTHLASASDDESICIWDVQSGDRIMQFKVDSTTCSVAFLSEGKRIVSGDWNGDVRLWDAESGEEIGESWNAGFPVLFLTFSPNDSRIVTAVANKWKSVKPGEQASEARCYFLEFVGYFWAEQARIQIWDSKILTRQTTLSPNLIVRENSVAFSPDGKRIVSGSSHGSVRVWDTETGKLVELAEMHHRSAVNFVAFSPDENHIASGGGDKVIRIWDAQTGNPIRVLEGHTHWVWCGAYSPDGTKIVSGSWDKTLQLWDAVNGKQIGTGEQLTGPEDHITAVSFSPDGSCFATASKDSTIRLWDGHTGGALGEPLTGHNDVCCIAFSPDGTRIVSGGLDSIMGCREEYLHRQAIERT